MLMKLIIVLVLIQVVMGSRREGFKLRGKGIEYNCKEHANKKGVDCFIRDMKGMAPTTRFTCDIGGPKDGGSWNCRDKNKNEYNIPIPLIAMGISKK